MQQAELSFGVRRTSRDAYRELQDTGKAGTQRAQILETMLKKPVSYTRSELSKATGLTINAVSGRVNEMIRDGVIVESTWTRQCNITGKNVHELFCVGEQR